MRIIVKSAPKATNFQAKINDGENLIEVQLTSWFTTEQMLNDSMKPDMDVIHVHTPLLENEKDQPTDAVNIDELLCPFSKDVLLDTCKYAEKLAGYYKHDIKIIIHNCWSKKDWEKCGLLNDVVNVFQNILVQYPHVLFAIENVSPLSNFGFRSGCYPEDAAYLAKTLNERLSTNRFSTVIDICHLLMTNFALRNIAQNNDEIKILSIEELFAQSNNMCSVIHLNNKIGDGFGKNHGTPFTDSKADIKLMDQILKAYQVYTPNADIVVEVREDDYLDCKNCRQTIRILKQELKKLGFADPVVWTEK